MTLDAQIVAHLEKQQDMNALLIKQIELLTKRIELVEGK
jgi:hypothetical protein